MLIGSREIEKKTIDQLVRDIKKKKELGHLAEDFVQETLKRYLSQNPKKISFLSQPFSEKSGEYKEIIKKVRGELRRVHGLYKNGKEATQRGGYFQELLKTSPGQEKFLEWQEKILGTHSSSRERADFYKELYTKIFKITGEPKKVIDLGCGLGPFSFPFMKLEKLTFYAYDIDQEEINLIQRYFDFLRKKEPGFYGEAKVMNLNSLEKIREMETADLCFLWKMTEMLDRDKRHKISEEVIKSAPARYVAVSFPTFTVKGRPMNRPRRKWIELMCKRLGYKYQIIKERNEIFYVIKK